MKHFLYLVYLVFSIQLSAQNTCSYPGDDSRWETRFKMPGATGASVKAMLPTDEYLYMLGPNTYGGEAFSSKLVRFDGEKYEAVGREFYCTSCVPQFTSLAQDDDGNIYISGYFLGAKNSDGSSIDSRNVIKWNIETESWEAIGQGVGVSKASALAWNNDTLYVGGQFEYAYNLTDTIAVNNIALFSTISNQWDSLGSGISSSSNAEIKDIQVSENGTVMVAGNIETAGGLNVYSVARWNPNSGWDNWGGGLPLYNVSTPDTYMYGTGYKMQHIESTGDVFAVGYFGQISASASDTLVRQFAKWSGSQWNLIQGLGVPSGFSGWTVPALYYDVDSNEVYIGGNFYKYTNNNNEENEPVASKIVKYNVQTGLYSELAQGILPTTAPYYGSTVRCITKWHGRIWAGGNFNNMGNTFGTNLGSFDGSEWDNIGDGLSNHIVYSIMANGSDVYISGFLYNARLDGELGDDLVSWNDTSSWTNLDLGLQSGGASNYNKIITTTKVIGDKIWFGGLFTGIADTINSRGIGTYDLVTGLIEGFGEGFGGPTSAQIYDFEEFQGDVYVAGNFSSMDGISVSKLAKYSNGVWSSIGTFNGNVFTLENVGDSVLFIGGTFTNVDEIEYTQSLVMWDGNTFMTVGNGIGGYNSWVSDMEMDVNGVLQIVGRLNNAEQFDGTTISGVHYLLQYSDSLYSNDANLQVSGSVSHVVTDTDGTVYFAGEFTSTSGVYLSSIGRWNPQYGVMGFGQGVASSTTASDDIRGIAIVDSLLYTIGSHTRLGLSQSSGIGRYLIEDNIPFIPEFTFSDTLMGCDSLTLTTDILDATVVWSTGDTAQSITVNTSSTVYVTASNEFDCVQSDTIVLIITGYTPEAIITQNLLGQNDSIQFIADPMEGALSYNWIFGDGNSDEGQSLTYTYGQEGVFTVQLIVATDCGTDTTEVIVEIIYLSIDNEGNDLFISLYPNPVNEVLNIEADNIQLDKFEILDFSGKLVLSGKIDSRHIDVSHLAKSLYILQIYPKEGSAKRIRFVKM